jgi:uncharacterized protein YbjQ (UPF0145 family)
MDDAIGLIIQLGIPAMLLLIGMLAGAVTERRHLRNLAHRERATAGILVTNVKSFPGGADARVTPSFVSGDVVISSDYMKTFIAGIKKIFGGQLGSYQILMTRARREAILRMVEEAQRQGFNAVCNVRLDTVDITFTSKSRGMPSIPVFATGTAYRIPGRP